MRPWDRKVIRKVIHGKTRDRKIIHEGISYYRGRDQVRPWDRKVIHGARMLRGSPTIEDQTR